MKHFVMHLSKTAAFMIDTQTKEKSSLHPTHSCTLSKSEVYPECYSPTESLVKDLGVLR